jgi:VIT1/CCC1 family predicted Fe2+/Mn2+ transporter
MTLDLRKHRAEVHGFGRLQENLAQIVYGGNDGIVTTFAVVAGFAGARAEGIVAMGAVAVLLFGFANLFADATSMGLGAFLSARSRRDVYAVIRAQELRAIRHGLDGERAEVHAILEDRGVAEADRAAFLSVLERNPALMADFMMAYEFGLPDPDGDNPARDAAYTFAAFLLFGLIPLMPYILLPADAAAFAVSVVATFGALFLLGLLRWYATQERLAACLAETVLVGGICAAVAYGVGMVIGG